MRILAALIISMIAVGCADQPAPPPLKQRVTGDYIRDPGDTDAVLAATYAYWSAVEGGRMTEAWGYHALDYREKVPYNQWLTETSRSPAEDRRPTEIHWMKNATRVHGPELYAVVSWISPTARGRVLWRQTDAGRWEIESTERL